MTLVLTQSLTAIGPSLTSSFLGVGGTAPYTYIVLPGGPGGSINAGSGLYTAPANASQNPRLSHDTIKVTDALSAEAVAKILIGSPLLLFCDVLQKSMGLDTGRVYLWDQKINEPTDSGLFIAVSVPSCKPFGNVNRPASSDGLESKQFISMSAVVDIDIISRGTSARDRKEEILLALNSNYSLSQQYANSFYIARIPSGFTNLSEVDGAAIPYRYRISVNVQYAFSKNTEVEYYDDFTKEVFTDE